MDRHISDVINICRDLGSEKGPERRKAALKLKNTLSQAAVKQCLDRNFETKQRNGGKLFSWENIFKAVCVYVSMETEELRHANENVSRTTLANRETRKQDVSALVKFVIRAADKGCPKMKGSAVFSHITEILREPYTCAAYGQDYCSILLKNILSTRKYIMDLNANSWHELVFQFFKLFNDPDVGIDKLILARIIHSLVRGLTVQCDVRPKKILSFFSDFFGRVRQFKSPLLLEHMLLAVNVFVRSVGPTSRVQVCKLGEEVIPGLLYLWSNVANDTLKDCLVEFLQGQLECHHPCGQKQEDPGSYALDWDKWMSHLRKLYEIMYTEIQQTGSKNRNKDCVLKDAYVNLAVDVCQQVFTETVHCIDVTQVPSTSGGDTQPGPSVKKRRLESGWEAVRNILTSLGQSVKLLPWLQLVSQLVDKYTASIPRSEIAPYLSCLSNLLADCKRFDLMTHMLNCLHAFAKNWTRLEEVGGEHLRDQTRAMWNQIWSVAKRSVSLHHDGGYPLLTAIIEQGLVVPGSDVWSLFVPSVSHPTTQSVQFVCRLIQKYDLPEKLVPNLMVSLPCASTDSGYPLRKQLIDWLLPFRDDGNESAKLSCNVDHDWTAHTLVSLTLKDPAMCYRQPCRDDQPAESLLERTYMESCLQLPLRVTSDTANSDMMEKPGGIVHVAVLQQELEAIIKRDVQYYCDQMESMLTDLEQMITYAGMTFKIVDLLLDYHIIPLTTLHRHPLVDCVTRLMKKISSVIIILVKKEGTSSMKSLMGRLLSLYSQAGDRYGAVHTSSNQQGPSSQARDTVDHRSASQQGPSSQARDTVDHRSVVAQVCRMVTPSRLVELWIDLAHDQGKTAGPQEGVGNQARGNRSASNGSRARVLDDFDDLDIEFDDESNSNNNNMVEDVEMEDAIDSQETEEAGLSLEEHQSITGSRVLSESQQMRLDAVKLLCLWSSHSQKLPRDLSLKSEVDVKHVRSKLLALISDPPFDPSRPVDLQILIVLGRFLTGESSTEKEIDTLLKAARLVSRVHRKNQDVCATSLDLLSQLVPCLSSSAGLSASSLQQCRESALHLINVFWMLQVESESQFSSTVRQALAKLMEKLVECDPQSAWCQFPSDNQLDSDTGDDEGRPTALSRLVYCGGDYCHLVRLCLTGAVHKLFIDGPDGHKLKDRHAQATLFDQVVNVLKESLDIEGRMSVERQEDERRNRVSSVLLTLAEIICSSPASERKAVSTILHLIAVKQVDVESIRMILKKVCHHLSYLSIQKFLTAHLPYLLHHWLNELKLEEFPYQLFDCQSMEHFYRTYSDTIIPELVLRKDGTNIETVAAALDVDGKTILADCVPRIVVHILPLFAASKLPENKEDDSLRRRTHKATACYEFLTKQLSEQTVERSIAGHLDEIVVHLLMCLYDTNTQNKTIRDSQLEANPPSYSSSVIQATLDYLTRSFSGSSNKTLVEILAKTTDGIQKILLQLSVELCSQHRLDEKLRVLLMYQLFTRLLLKQFNTQLGGAWAFILRDVLTRLVHLVRDMSQEVRDESTASCYKETISCLALGLLRELCMVAMETCPQELIKYVPLLTSNLVAVAERGQEGEQAMVVLRFLILENADTIKATIASLDNFPDKPVFQDFREMHQKLKYASGPFTLQKEVSHFLALCQQQNLDSDLRLEGLRFLHRHLVSHKDQLTIQVADDYVPSLVFQLVQLCKSSSESVRQEAGRCLGEIGPVNLHTICFPAQQHSPGLQLALEAFKDTPQVEKYCKIFHCLNEYLTDKNIELVECSSKVLKTLLSVGSGMEFSSGYMATLDNTEYLFHYLHPFRSQKKKAKQMDGPARSWDRFVSTVDQEALWNPRNCSHSNWVITLTMTLINSGAVEDGILRLLSPVCAMKTEFCELVLPYVVHDLLLTGSEDHREVVSRQVDNFFMSHCGQAASGRLSRCQSLTSASIVTEDDYVCMNANSVRTMLGIIQYLRQQSRPALRHKQMTPWENNFWLDIDYLQVAVAAQYCSAYFSTMLYAEIWCDVQREKTSVGVDNSGSHSQDTRMDTLSDASSSPSGVNVQDLLLEAYRWIGDPDGVYSCGAGRKPDTSSRIRTYQHEDHWDKALMTCDIQMSTAATANQYEVLNALKNFGSSHILETYMQGMMGNEAGQNLSSDTKELKFEAAWRMGQWSIDIPNKLSATVGFHESLYRALRGVVEDHKSLTDTTLTVARQCAVTRLKEVCLDSTRTLYPALADLQCVAVIEAVVHAVASGVTEDPKGLLSCASGNNDFIFREPMLQMTCTALRVLWQKCPKNKPVYTLYVKSLHNLARISREAGRHQLSERAIFQLKSLEIPDLSLNLLVQMEEAQMFWARGEHDIAKRLLRGLIDRLSYLMQDDRVAAGYYPQVLSIYGNWLADTRSENPNVIMENYLQKTVEVFESQGERGEVSLNAYLSLARYADTQYQSIDNYMKSSTFEAKKALMQDTQTEARGLREIMGQTDKDSRYLTTIEKQTSLDNIEYEQMLEDKDRFLLHAVGNYIKCLKFGDIHNLRVFRLTSLWFSNTELVNPLIKDNLSEIASYKWLPLMYQLAARMDVKSSKGSGQAFIDTLEKLIYQTCVHHPHHTLFCVEALANANRDTELLQQGKSRAKSKMSKSQPDTPVEEGRVQAAKSMIERLRKDKKVGGVVRDMEMLCDAYIQLANWNVSQYKTETKPIQLPAALWISKVKDLENIPVPTRDIKVDQSGRYIDIPYLQKFESTFKLAGGINLPKIITCYGSDGKTNRQLVKGRDDLRQDAVMQQVFDMVNQLLLKDTETRKRQLQIRKYKVIPLSQRSGLLEWCEGTQPIGEYLVGRPGHKGAHTIYRPQDWPAFNCRKHLAAACNVGEKVTAYKEICVNFQPVFRHFLLEKFSAPALWFERRLAYTRSVATNSIVGYILGLGDRHVQNILIDCNSAELVHIDLGVAFEQGKILPTPETVPFRLTRDIEDAMGASGVEGVFRRCCEKTLEVMRHNKEALLTILEVLLYDPLHAWTISPAKAYALQHRRDRTDNDTIELGNTSSGDILDIQENASNKSETQEKVNKLAERSLLRLQQKLQGVEEGVQLSLCGQVNHLIQEAHDPKNLSRLYAGWQPYI